MVTLNGTTKVDTLFVGERARYIERLRTAGQNTLSLTVPSLRYARGFEGTLSRPSPSYSTD